MIEAMFIDRAGLPFILVAALPLAAAGGVGAAGGRGRVPFLVLAAFFVFFFRDPDRTMPTEPQPGRVAGRRPRDDRRAISPAQGAPRGRVAADQHLSVADGRAREPHAGRPARSRAWSIIPGSSCPPTAWRPAQLNEWTEVWFETRRPTGRRAGRSSASSRAASSAGCKTGDTVERGQRFGVMKFGSRMDLFVPPDATHSA